MITRSAIVAAGLLLAACGGQANLAALREAPPARTATVPGDYAHLAACVTEEMQLLPTVL